MGGVYVYVSGCVFVWDDCNVRRMPCGTPFNNHRCQYVDMYVCLCVCVYVYV